MNILGKEISNKTILIVSGVLLLGLGGYVYARKVKGKKIYEELMNKLTGEAKVQLTDNVGGYSSSKTGKTIIWTSYTAWANYGYKSTISDEIIAKGILNNLNIEFFKSNIKSQAQFSKIANMVYKNNKKMIYQYLRKAEPEVQNAITEYLNNLPLK